MYGGAFFFSDSNYKTPSNCFRFGSLGAWKLSASKIYIKFVISGWVLWDSVVFFIDFVGFYFVLASLSDFFVNTGREIAEGGLA